MHTSNKYGEVDGRVRFYADMELYWDQQAAAADGKLPKLPNIGITGNLRKSWSK